MCAQTKTAKFLSPNQISELVWNSKSDKAGVLSNSSSEGEDKPGVFPASIILYNTRYTLPPPPPKIGQKKLNFVFYTVADGYARKQEA
jgi:hypothetical protein